MNPICPKCGRSEAVSTPRDKNYDYICASCWYYFKREDATPAPNEAEKEPHEMDVREMDGDYLVELAVQLRARACTLDCSRELHERSFEVLNEVRRRVAENARLTSKLAEMEVAYTQAQSDLSTSQQYIGELKETRDRLIASLDSAQRKLAEMEKERDEWKREASQHLADTVKLTTGFNEELDSLRQELEKMRGEG